MNFMIKTCSRCKETKSLELFYRDRTTADGRTPQCKTCRYSPIGREHLRKPDKLCNKCKVRKDKSEFLVRRQQVQRLQSAEGCDVR